MYNNRYETRTKKGLNTMIDRKKRNEHILFACADVFYEKGIEKATMRNFSEAVGYSPATIYQSYKDKHEIVKHCLVFCVEQRNNVINEIFKENMKHPERLFKCFKARKEEIMKWCVVIMRIITSPYYKEMQDGVNDLNMTAIGGYEKQLDEDVLALFMMYYSAVVHYAISGNDRFLEIEEKYIEAELNKRLEK